MDKIGIIKDVDKMGRILIPKELRERFGLTEQVELIITKSGILLKSPKYILVKAEENETPKPI